MSVQLRCSVVVCVYNGASRLPITLKHLAAQQGMDSAHWEVILVDNASNDDSGATAAAIWPALSAVTPLRVMVESRPGLTHARSCGVAAAQGAVIVFVDDDNWLAPDYLHLACAILESRPDVGICGGRVDPAFEAPPPPWFHDHQNWFAVGRQAPRSGEVDCIWGCGMAVRAQLAREMLLSQDEVLLSDRIGSSLSSGGDTQLSLRVRLAGWKVWYAEELRLKHWMPATRMQWRYLVRLVYAIGQDEQHLKRYRLALRHGSTKALSQALRSSRLLYFVWSLFAIGRHLLLRPTSIFLWREDNRHSIPLLFRAGNLVGLFRRTAPPAQHDDREIPVYEARTLRLRIGLVCTAPIGAPGSMSAYREVLMAALSEFAPQIEVETVQLGLPPSAGRWRQRWHTMSMPFALYRRSPPDIWHILDGSRAYVGFGLRSAPVVITAHDVIPVLQAARAFPGAPRVGHAARWMWQVNAAAIRRSERVICVSQSTANDLRQSFGLGSAELPVIGLPVRTTLMQFAGDYQTAARDKGRILHVGNNSFYKWREQALKVFARLPGHCRLTMIGPRPPRELVTLVSSLGVDGRVSFVEEPSDRELAEHYLRTELLIFPSRYEGFGWPVLEAMSFGVPVVASNRGSLPEVVGDAAETLDPDDLDQFAAAACRLLECPVAWQRASARAWKRAQCFAIRDFALAMAGQYRAVAKPSTRAHCT